MRCEECGAHISVLEIEVRDCKMLCKECLADIEWETLTFKEKLRILHNRDELARYIGNDRSDKPILIILAIIVVICMLVWFLF